jgi:RNA polymerase sigma-70 factor (ECF subfamily)
VAASEDLELVRAALAGDRRVLDDLVRATRDHVWRYCAYLGSGLDVDDLVQETYVRALRSLPRFEGRSPFRVFLLGIARRVCADAVRTARRRRRFDALVVPRAASVADPAPEIGVRILVEALAPERRDAFVLTQLVGLSYAEAAEVCGVPVGTIRSRVARAREDLRTELNAATG